MLLAIDIGNTETTLGLFRGDRLMTHWRLTTAPTRTPDEWASVFTSFLSQAGHSPNEVRASVIASVVPTITERLTEGANIAVGTNAVPIGPDSTLPVVLDVDEPFQVGADRIVNTIAASQLYGRDTIVVDFGTATTFDCITADGHFLGGVIAPGVHTAAENLTRRTAKLPATDLVPPQHVIGRRTEECMRSGILFGTVDAVDGIVSRIKQEWPREEEPFTVATGGLAERVAPYSKQIEHVEPHLTLQGLRIAAKHMSVHW